MPDLPEDSVTAAERAGRAPVLRRTVARVVFVDDDDAVGEALRLAQHGFDVTGVDLSDDLLDVARRAAADEPEEVADRIRFERGDLLGLAPELAGCFDVVCCHGVLMYLPSLADGVAALVRAARPGGLISVLTRNRAGIAMRAAMAGTSPVRHRPSPSTISRVKRWSSVTSCRSRLALSSSGR